MSDKICYHKHTVREVVGGMSTDDRICTECGALLSRQELKEARAAEAAAKKNQTPIRVFEPEDREHP